MARFTSSIASAVVGTILCVMMSMVQSQTANCRFCATQAQTCLLKPLCKAYTQTISGSDSPSDAMLQDTDFVNHLTCHLDHCQLSSCAVCSPFRSNCTQNSTCNAILSNMEDGNPVSTSDLQDPLFGQLTFCVMDSCIQDNEYLCQSCIDEEDACLDSDSCLDFIKANSDNAFPSVESLANPEVATLLKCEVETECTGSVFACDSCQAEFFSCVNNTGCNPILGKHVDDNMLLTDQELSNPLFSALLSCTSENCPKVFNPATSGTSGSGSSGSGSGSFFLDFEFSGSASGINGTSTLPPTEGSGGGSKGMFVRSISATILLVALSFVLV